MMKSARTVSVFSIVSAFAVISACDDPEGLVAECVDPGDSIPASGWVCGEDKVVDGTSAEGAGVHTIYAQLESGSCDDTELYVSDSGPFSLGAHEISVRSEPDDGASFVLCTSALTVVDTIAPAVQPKTVEIWPPNHKFHTIGIDDC